MWKAIKVPHATPDNPFATSANIVVLCPGSGVSMMVHSGHDLDARLVIAKQIAQALNDAKLDVTRSSVD